MWYLSFWNLSHSFCCSHIDPWPSTSHLAQEVVLPFLTQSYGDSPELPLPAGSSGARWTGAGRLARHRCDSQIPKNLQIINPSVPKDLTGWCARRDIAGGGEAVFRSHAFFNFCCRRWSVFQIKFIFQFKIKPNSMSYLENHNFCQNYSSIFY